MIKGRLSIWVGGRPCVFKKVYSKTDERSRTLIFEFSLWLGGVEGHAGKDRFAGTGTLKDARAVGFSIKSPAVDSGVGAGASTGSPYTSWRVEAC